jgi:predicted  nucleic acid-binding Zn-ribbon protein
VRADPSAQQQLLDVQELDSRLDVLRAHAANPPEQAELVELIDTRAGIDREAGALEVQVGDLTREQAKADADVEHVKARRVRDRQRLDTGAVGNPKDLERLQHELVALDKRIDDLEEAELDVMERLETAQKDLDQLRSRLADVDQRIATVTESRERRLVDLREQAGTTERDRAARVEGLPEDLLALYTRIREQKGGVGAAALRARRCGGCSLELNSAELADIAAKPAEEVVRCDECGRILVRTVESGL